MTAATTTLQYTPLPYIPYMGNSTFQQPQKGQHNTPILERPSREVDATTSEYAGIASNPNLAQHFAKLTAIKTDRSLWVEDADPPSLTSIALGQILLQLLEVAMLQPTRVVASAEGGIAVCFVSGDKYADIECLNTGSILAVTSNRRDRPIVWEIEPDLPSIVRSIEKIGNFLRDQTSHKNVPTRKGSRHWLSAFRSPLS